MIGLFLGLSALQTPFEGKPLKMWNEAELGACHLTQAPPKTHPLWRLKLGTRMGDIKVLDWSC